MTSEDNRLIAVRALQSYRDELRSKAERLKHDLLAVEHSLTLLSNPAVAEERSDSHNSSPYAGRSPQAAVELLLQQNPTVAFKPSVAARRLLELGCVPTKASYYATQVRSALIRAVAKGIAVESQVDGKATFKLKQPQGG